MIIMSHAILLVRNIMLMKMKIIIIVKNAFLVIILEQVLKMIIIGIIIFVIQNEKNCEQMGTASNNMCTECYSNYTLIGTNC